MNVRDNVRDLEVTVNRINETFNRPLSYVKSSTPFICNIGYYLISCGSGSYALECVVNESGGIVTIKSYSSPSKLHAFMEGMIIGHHTRKKENTE